VHGQDDFGCHLRSFLNFELTEAHRFNYKTLITSL